MNDERASKVRVSDDRAFWHLAPGRGELRPVTLPALRDGHVRVRSRFGAISQGTERLVARGEVPESEYQRMRAPFQDGDFPFPVKYGYINVGTVEAGPPELLDRDVFCLHPHQSRYVVPASAVTVLPAELPARRAILTANTETALNALWDAAPRIGDRIAVVGAGAVGCLVARLASRLPGTRVQLIDIDAGRRDIAEALGLDFRAPDTADGECDLVVHASGHGEGLATGLSLAGFEATVLELSWYGTREVSAPLGGAFHSRRLTLRASQVGHIATARRARHDYASRLQLALSLLDDPALDALIDAEGRFDELPDIMAALADGTGGGLCRCITY